MNLLQIVVTIFSLSFLVLFHEAGHFVAAKILGWPVEEFGIGYPPRLFAKKFGETIFSFNLIPFGGFCGFSEDTMYKKPKKEQTLVILSGVVANFILGWFLFSILFTIGSPYSEGRVFIDEVEEGTPAAEAQLNVGDQVVAVQETEIKNPGDLLYTVERNAGKEVTLEIKREGMEGTLKIAVVPRTDPPEGQGPLGISWDFEGEDKFKKYVWYMAPVRALEESATIVKDMFSGLAWMLKKLIFAGRVPKELGGPVGIFDVTAQASMLGIRYLLQLLAFLSLNLFLLNLFPIPALDGGQLVFVGIEVLRGKRVKSETRQLVNAVGMALLALLAILVTIQDVRRLI